VVDGAAEKTEELVHAKNLAGMMPEGAGFDVIGADIFAADAAGAAHRARWKPESQEPAG
jgi:hypothetical protein